MDRHRFEKRARPGLRITRAAPQNCGFDPDKPASLPPTTPDSTANRFTAVPRSSSSSNASPGSAKAEPATARLELDLNEQTRASRHQQRIHRARLGLRAACLVLLTIALVSGSRSALRQMFFDNPDYQIQTIRITTNGTLAAGEVTQVVNIHEGDSLLRVNLQSVRAAVEALPQVRSASVTRTLPSELAIRIDERRAAARVIDTLNEDSHIVSIDRHGVVLPASAANSRSAGLPAIQLPGIEPVEPGQTLAHPMLEPSLELLELHAVRQQTFAMPASIDASKPYALHCLYPDGMEVLFQPRDLPLQFHRLERIADNAAGQQRSVASVNLLAQDNLPVEFRPRPTLDTASLTNRGQVRDP